ncbi:MAG: Na+/H+ antiporter NhaC family protein, partial [Bacillota bacterium]|nr:Na+/H+ antiporter NhaC family protein [Bacillota bacterium]
KGVSSPMNAVLIMILIVVGIFTQLMSISGVAKGFVWLGSSIGLTGGMFTAFTFIATCVIATATGSSIGTLFSALPILYPSGILLGADPTLLAGAVLSGAIFGDNLAPVSDTTIASASTQIYKDSEKSADIGGVVSSRFKYAIVAAVIAAVAYFIFGGGGEVSSEGNAILQQYMDPKGLIMLIPVAILIGVAIKTREIFTALIWGIVSGTVIALASGVITIEQVMSVSEGSLNGFIIDGVTGMLGLVAFSIALFGIIGILNESGTMDSIIEGIAKSKLAKTPAGSEVAIAIGMMLSSMSLGSANGPAIIMFGPIANKIGRIHKLHPYRRANLLDGFGSTIPVIMPFVSAFIFIVLIVVQGLQGEYAFIQDLNPIRIALGTFHPIALFFVLSYSVATGWGREFEGEDEKVLQSKPE